MLKNLLECKLPTKLLIIAVDPKAGELLHFNLTMPVSDTENVTGLDLFLSALKNHTADSETAKINLICYENPPSFYLSESDGGKIDSYNYFTDPCGWKCPSAPKSDLSSFISNECSISETTFFIDSLSHLANYHGYSTVYKVLSALKQLAKKTICLLHCDLFSSEEVEELRFLATAFISVELSKGERTQEEKAAEVLYKKSGGKVIKQSEGFSVSDELNIISTVSSKKAVKAQSGREDIEDLTTFKLGLRMSENERKAKEELILPYVRRRVGEIIYQPDADELEEDPDDDLDI